MNDIKEHVQKKASDKPLLLEEHRRRLAWCISNQDREWSRIFTDESRMQFYSNVRRQLVKQNKKPLNQKKFGPALMLWEGVSMRGLTPLAICHGTVGSDEYIKTLDA